LEENKKTQKGMSLSAKIAIGRGNERLNFKQFEITRLEEANRRKSGQMLYSKIYKGLVNSK
jgi:hypothetical protein